MIQEILFNIWYFLKLTLTTDLLWFVFPLGLITIIMLFYFEKYKDEKPEWSTHVSNSLILLTVSIILLRNIYSIDNNGLINYITYFDKFIITSVLFIIGIIVFFLNFKHFLPEKIAGHITSPLSLNSIAYIIILHVHSKLKYNLSVFLSLVVLLLIIIILLNFLRIPINSLFRYLKKLKEKEKKEIIIQDKEQIEKKKEEKIIKKQKREIKKEEKEVTKVKIKELHKQKNEAVKLKKLMKKPIKKVRK